MDRADWIERFTRIHDGDAEGEAYHGPATRTVLATIPAERAAARPLAGAHTIGEIVQHVLAWRELIRGRLAEGHTRRMLDDEDWRPFTTPWPELLAKLEANQRAWLALLETAPEDDLARFESLLRFLVHHEVAHMGQVALLRRAGGDAT